MFTVLVSYVVFMVLDVLKTSVTPSILDCANVILSGLWVWRYFTLTFPWYEHHALLIWGCRTIQGIIFGNPLLTVVLQLFVTIADISAYKFAHDINSANDISGFHTYAFFLRVDVLPQLCMLFFRGSPDNVLGTSSA